MKNNKHYAYESPFHIMDSEGVKYTLNVEQEDCPEDPRDWDNICTMVCCHRYYELGDKHDYDGIDDFFQSLCKEVIGKGYDDTAELYWQDMFKMLDESNLILIKPINMYEHSGITVSTSNGYPYNDRWDAGCVGFIYVTKKTIFEEGCQLAEKDENGEYILIEHKHENAPSTYSHKFIPTTDENWKDVADNHIEAEMKVYDQYLRGDVYGYKLIQKVVVNDICPHCGEVVNQYEEEKEIDSCWGFYGDCLEDNGILDNLGGAKFVEED